MVVYTAKLNKKKIIGIAVIIAVIIAAIIMTVPNRTVPQSTNAPSEKIKGDSELLVFITDMGYTVKEGSLQCREVTIPKEFDEVYEKYNKMQRDCGYNLEKYKGKAVNLYTAELTNHPEGENVIVEVLVYKTKPIGGSIYTKNLDGFMYGLTPLQQGK